MSVDTEISSFAEQMEKLRPFADKDIHGEKMLLDADENAAFKRLALEAKGAIDHALGKFNDFSTALSTVMIQGTGVFGTSYATVSEAAQILRGAANQYKRQLRSPPTNTGIRTAKPAYVDFNQLAELRSISSKQWDFSRLIQLCVELNAAHERDSYLTIAMIVRAITDHVPPIFGQPSFQGVTNNYAGQKSFKNSMTHLDRSLRSIADSALHTQIRQKESVPGAAQVNFGADLAVLLAEVIRISG